MAVAVGDGDREGAAARELVREFYGALGLRDPAAIEAMYAPDATFSDPVFGDLQGAEIGAMWRMLTSAAPDLRVEVGDVTARGGRAAATWQAWYSFSETGRRVHNVVEAHMTIANSRIVRHDDHFDIWRWSSQAFGPAGRLLGWSPSARLLLRSRARRRLDAFIAAEGKRGAADR